MDIKKATKGASSIVGVMITVVLLMVGVIILYNLDTSFAASFTGGTYAGVYGNTTANSQTATGLMALLPILLGAGILIAAVMSFASKS